MPTLVQSLTSFLQVDRRPATNRQYDIILSKLVAAIGPARDIRRITYEDLLDYFAQLRATGLKPSTLRSYGRITRSFFSWCLQRDYIETNPAAPLTFRRECRDPSKTRAIPSEELRRIVDYARATSPRNYALLLFLADTGCRIGGAASLTLERLDLTNHLATIEEKGGIWVRVRFGTETATALERWLEQRPSTPHTYVWTGKGPNFSPLKANSISAVIAGIADAVGASRRWRGHSLRHAVGEAYAHAGVPVTVTQRKLNHADPRITYSFYYPDGESELEVISERLALAPLKQHSG